MILEIALWKGMNIEKFCYTADDNVWTITELLTAQDLFTEGQKMKNCLASYAFRCASGNSAVFSLKCASVEHGKAKLASSSQNARNATLEVNPLRRSLVQAKGKCNTALLPGVMNVVKRWAEVNRISVQVLV